MIKKELKYYIIILLISITAYGQAEQYRNTNNLSGESVGLFTDRTIYCVNEKIYFTAEYFSVTELDSVDWSSVLYIELIKWDGTKLAQKKFKLIKPGTHGFLEIPGNIISGNYYLRAYTKWMRNFQVDNYAYNLVKIINPFKSEIDRGPLEKKDGGELEIVEATTNIALNNIRCSSNKKEYDQREKVEVEFSLNNKEYKNPKKFCISVSKVGSVVSSNLILQANSQNNEGIFPDVEYLPEIRGMTISGKVIDMASKQPLNGKSISLSEPKYGSYYSVYKANESGRFVFSLPDMYGQQDFIIQAEQTDSQSIEILIDEDFCNHPVILPFIPFSLDSSELALVREIIVNMQLSDRFLTENDSLSASQNTNTQQQVFYGSKKSLYETSKYIELPNIKEFIYEVVLEAIIVNEKGKGPRIDLQKEYLSNNTPLILMDNVEVKNDEKLLRIPLNRISRVEVINMNYAIGSAKYAGIINIYSKKNDFAGLELNKNSKFFTYELFSDTSSGTNVNTSVADKRIPDRRNLLYWDPDFQFEKGDKPKISFYTSDCKGDYIVYIREKSNSSSNGVFGVYNFTVK